MSWVTVCTWDNPKIPKEVSKIAHAFTINFSFKRLNALCHAAFSEHLGATFGRNRTELGWLKLALLGTIAGGAGAFVDATLGRNCWWYVLGMADSQDAIIGIFTIKLSLYDKKRRWRMWISFVWHVVYQTLNIILEMGVSPSTQDAGNSHHQITCRLLDHSLIPCNSSILEFLKDPKPTHFTSFQRCSVLKSGLRRVF